MDKLVNIQSTKILPQISKFTQRLSVDMNSPSSVKVPSGLPALPAKVLLGGAGRICIDYPFLVVFVLFILIGVFMFLRQREAFSEVKLFDHLTKDDLLKEIRKLKDDIFNTNVKVQKCERDLVECRDTREDARDTRDGRDDRDSAGPTRKYTTDVYNFYQVGFVTDGTKYFPLFGRRLYKQRSDKWEYYIIEDSENRVKIPIDVKNDNELYDDDTVTVNNLQYTVKLYEYKNVRYIP
jgi:hypothetical protein